MASMSVPTTVLELGRPYWDLGPSNSLNFLQKLIENSTCFAEAPTNRSKLRKRRTLCPPWEPSSLEPSKSQFPSHSRHQTPLPAGRGCSNGMANGCKVANWLYIKWIMPTCNQSPEVIQLVPRVLFEHLLQGLVGFNTSSQRVRNSL